MLTKRAINLTFAVVCTAPWALAVVACGTANDAATTEAVDHKQEPIAAEVPGKVEIVGRHRLDDPGLVLASYALPGYAGCSATMIGPSTMMTAGHCGFGPSTAQFRVFDGADPVANKSETFNCTYLLFTYPDTDLNLFHCAPNAAGERPGDKYGYVDSALNFRSDGKYDAGASGQRTLRTEPDWNVDGIARLRPRRRSRCCRRLRGGQHHAHETVTRGGAGTVSA